MAIRVRPALLLLLGLPACATSGAIKRLETQIAMNQREQERRDSTHLATLQDITVIQQSIMDSLKQTERAISLAKGESSADLLEIRRSMNQLQERIDQSSRRVSEFYSELDARQAALDAQRDTTGTATSGVATAQQMLQAGNAQLNQGAFGTARDVFQQLLVTHPLSSLAPDALFGIAESYVTTMPDTAEAYYREVATKFPESMKAASAMYKLGDRAQKAGDRDAARRWFEKVAIAQYRGTDEYELAVVRLRDLR